MMGFYMVEIYTDPMNYTDPYNYMSEVGNIWHVRIWKSGITSWCNGLYAPRYMLGIL